MSKINELDDKIESILNKSGELSPLEFETLMNLTAALDVELDKASDLPEPDYGPNVLNFDQNKRKRQLNAREYKNDAQVLKFERKIQ